VSVLSYTLLVLLAVIINDNRGGTSKDCKLLLPATVCVITIKRFNYGYKNERNTHWQVGMYAFVVITP